MPDEYCPAEHVPQEAEPAAEELPAGQLMHVLAPTALYVPSPQVVQEASPEELKVPASQSVHEEEPASLVLPAPQLKQLELRSNAVYFPAAQFVQEAEPSPEYVPTPQSLQDDRPVEAAILPLAQFRQAEAPVPAKVPASHSAHASAVPVDSAFLPFSHRVQEAASAALYEPAAQSPHELASAAEKVPAAQLEQPALLHVLGSAKLVQILTLILPAVQPTHELEPSLRASEPDGHVVQVEEPRFWEYFPTPHVRQADVPVAGWCSPSPQSVQPVAFAEAAIFPSLHALHVAKPTVLAYVPARQSTQLGGGGGG